MTNPHHPQSLQFSRTVSFLSLLTLITGLMVTPALADSVAPPPPPVVDIPPPPPLPATIDPSEVRHAVARPIYSQPAPAEVQTVSYETQTAQVVQAPAVQYVYGDPYGFTAWLNGVRAQNGRGPVGYDAGLSGQAEVNNGQQHARGMGHHYMGSARRQNSGMGAAQTVWSMWMASPAHQAALLDPTITMIGIAASGSYWTFNAY